MWKACHNPKVLREHVAYTETTALLQKQQSQIIDTLRYWQDGCITAAVDPIYPPKDRARWAAMAQAYEDRINFLKTLDLIRS